MCPSKDVWKVWHSANSSRLLLPATFLVAIHLRWKVFYCFNLSTITKSNVTIFIQFGTQLTWWNFIECSSTLLGTSINGARRSRAHLRTLKNYFLISFISSFFQVVQIYRFLVVIKSILNTLSILIPKHVFVCFCSWYEINRHSIA